MLWANFIHIYQPPTQKPYWIRRITVESYRKIVTGLLAAPHAKLTLNINAILVELLDRYDGRDIIDGLKTLLRRGQIELTGSAKYHPLLPKLPKEEIVRQIKLNDETHSRYFGELYKPRGFFPPEMGFSPELGNTVASLGFSWLIIDELSFPNQHPNHQTIYNFDGLESFHLFFRERSISWQILSGQIGTGELLVRNLGKRLGKNEYLITAMDGETFGHHRPGLEQLLFEIYDCKEIQTVLISELPQYFKKRENIIPLPSTWALMGRDRERELPFARWDDPENPIHRKQWELTDLAVQTLSRANKKATGYNEARVALDRALHSDQYWWASAKPWWSLEMIERGAKELKDAILMTPGATARDKKKAEELYAQIIFTGFEWQREGIVEELAHAEDEDIRQRTDEGVAKLARSELEKMMANLQVELKRVVAREEFERAAQIRDRIAQLKGYAEKAAL